MLLPSQVEGPLIDMLAARFLELSGYNVREEEGWGSKLEEGEGSPSADRPSCAAEPARRPPRSFSRPPCMQANAFSCPQGPLWEEAANFRVSRASSGRFEPQLAEGSKAWWCPPQVKVDYADFTQLESELLLSYSTSPNRYDGWIVDAGSLLVLATKTTMLQPLDAFMSRGSTDANWTDVSQFIRRASSTYAREVVGLPVVSPPDIPHRSKPSLLGVCPGALLDPHRDLLH
jgi:hypothetical protein